MQRLMLLGTYEFTLDAKNRVAVPARLRFAFADGIYVTFGHEGCLSGFSQEEFQSHLERSSRGISPLSSKGRDMQRYVTANATFQSLDGQGRIALTPNALKHAGIEREVTIIGADDHIEIWNRSAWTEYRTRLEEEADATADELAT